ncbi:MAG: hypothetical protein J6A83_03745 [Clostridia bacterium]|nr:hypothetical protein [Clostridia bacterium]
MMAKRASSGYYRRNSYRRKKWRNILVISISVLAALLILFLVLGNILNKKTEGERLEETSPVKHPTQATTPPIATPSYTVSIKGGAVDIRSTELKKSFATLVENGFSAVSFNLSDTDGKLLYKSSVAARFGYQTADGGLADLDSVNASAASSGLATSAVLTLNSFTEEDKITRSVLQACEAAIICEIYDAGIDDIIIRCPELKAEHADELIELAKSISEINEKSIVGLALTGEFIESDSSALLIERLVSAFDFISLDITDISHEADLAEHIESSLSTDKYYYILRYNMRVLLPKPENDDSAKKAYELMKSNSITNWQTVS